MSTIQTTMVHARVPKKIKNDAKKVADKLGVSLSLIVEQALRDFSVNKQLIIEEPLVPTPYLEKILRQADKDIKEGNKDAFSPVFTNAKDMDEYLNNYVEECR